jgi:hypothetical protein
MSVSATAALQTIRCLAQTESSGSEPYIWPFLAATATNPGSFDTFPTAAILADSRKVVASSMKAGASAPLIFPGNEVTHTFADDQTGCDALLVVALLEADDSRIVSMSTGYQAFLDELRAQLGHNMLALKTATPDERDAIIAAIKKAVQKKAFDAVAGTLSAYEKTKVFFGAMDTDDFLAVGYILFESLETTGAPTAFTLHLATSGNEYEIDGVLNVVDVEPNRCQAQLDGVAAAEQAIRSLQRQVRALQAMLDSATRQQKAAIVDAIGRISDDQLPAAEEDLRRARYALRRCELLLDDRPGEPPIG